MSEGPNLKLAGLVILMTLAAVLVISKPYLSYQYVRASEAPITLQALVVTPNSRDVSCTKLFKIVDGKPSAAGVFPALPNDVPDPNTFRENIDGEIITITGYPYVWQTENLITGTKTQQAVNLIDVVAWQGKGYSFETKHADHSAKQFVRKPYKTCQ